jgi:hypothetical protein
VGKNIRDPAKQPPKDGQHPFLLDKMHWEYVYFTHNPIPINYAFSPTKKALKKA